MLRIYIITKPLYNLHRVVSIPLLGNRYRPFSTSSPLPPVRNANTEFTRYSITAKESEEIDRLLLLAKLKLFDRLFASLKSAPSLNTVIFNRILQLKYDVSVTREISVKEKIVEIMRARDLVLDAGTIVPLLSLYGRSGDVKKADDMLQRMIDGGLERTNVIYNSLIKCHERDIVRVDALFKEMKKVGIKPTVVTYNTMIQAYSLNGDKNKAVSLFEQMAEKEGIKPNHVTYNTMINVVYSKGGELDKAVELFNQMNDEKRLKPNVMIYNSMINVYGKLGSVDKVDEILLKMKDQGFARTVIIYNSLIKCHERDLLRVDALFKEMKEVGIRPTVVTYNSLINAYSKSEQSQGAVELFDQMINDGVKPTLITYNSMIHCYTQDGKLDEAEELLKRMIGEGIKPNMYLYNSMISGEAKFGNLEMVEKLFCRMLKDGLKPNDFVYRSLQTAYEKLNKEKAVEFVSRLKTGEIRAPVPGEWYRFLKSEMAKERKDWPSTA
jgi:pentatricopeptide repeat protein